MSSMGGIGEHSGPDEDGFESTLHLIAHAPVPTGLEERVQAVMEAGAQRARVFEWPWQASWVRAAAAAAIVLVITGGGWGVYWQVQQHQPAKNMVAPAPQIVTPAGGGFSSAGAIRTPQTVKGPAVETPAVKSARKPRAKKPKPTAIQPASENSIQPENGTAR